MPGTVELKTKRLLIRRHVAEDAKPLHEKFGQDPAMFEYSGWNPYATPEMAKKTVARFIAGYNDPHTYAWAIEHNGQLAGTIGAYDYDAEKNAIEVGMSIEKACWGKGFATEALTAVLHYRALAIAQPVRAHNERIVQAKNRGESRAVRLRGPRWARGLVPVAGAGA